LCSIYLVGPICQAGAMVTRSGNTVTVPSDSVIDDDMAVSGNLVRVGGRINGDLAAAGGTVVSEGSILGDLLAAGGNVTVRDTVGGSLRVVAGNAEVTSRIGRSATIFAGTILLEPGGSIVRNASLAGGEVTVLGPVGRDLTISAGQAAVGGTVGGSLTARVDRLTLLPEARVQGDLDVFGAQPPEISPEAKIIGRIRYHPVSEMAHGSLPQAPSILSRIANWAGRWLLQATGLFLLSILALTLAPRGFSGVAASLRRDVGRSALYGFAEIAAVPAAALMLMLTIVGIPVALTMLALYGAVLLLAETVIADRVGAWVLHRCFRRYAQAPASSYLRLCAGSLAVALLASLPFIGGLLQCAFLLVGSGAILAAIDDSRRRWKAGRHQAVAAKGEPHPAN